MKISKLRSLILIIQTLGAFSRSLQGIITTQSGCPIEYVIVGAFDGDEDRPYALAGTDTLGCFAFKEIGSAKMIKAFLTGM